MAPAPEAATADFAEPTRGRSWWIGRRLPRVEHWRVQLRKDLLDASRQQDDSALGAVRDADIARTTARQTRLVTSRQHAPDYLFALVILVSAVAVVLTTAFTITSIPPTLRRSLVGVLVVLLGLMLVVIVNLDRPFSGFQRIEPDDLAHVSANDTADYVRDWQEPVEACDSTGRPTAWGGALRPHGSFVRCRRFT